MFDEKEPGKPQNWGWTIGIIVVICTINLTIFVVIRIMLDSENEFDEPLIDGELRQALTKFLGIFALSFSFGCWCCFCCMGNCFKWAMCCFHQKARNSVSDCWASFLKHQHNVVNQVHKKSSTIFVQRRDRVHVPQDDRDSLEEARMKKPKGSNGHLRGPCVQWELDEQEADDEGFNTTLRTRPKQLDTLKLNQLYAKRKTNQWMEIHKPPTHNRSAFEHPRRHRKHSDFRRHSVAVEGLTQTSVGVNNVHYYEIPVSLMTPSAVAIIDPGFASVETTDSDDSISTKTVLSPTVSPVVSPTSPMTSSLLAPTILPKIRCEEVDLKPN